MKKILVIDDELIIRVSCERALSSEGYEVKAVSSGSEGLALLEKEPFTLILLDLKMPGMDGMDVLEKINEKWPEAKVIVITGYSTVETAVKVLRSGAFNYIEKPFTPDTLLAAVKEALESAN